MASAASLEAATLAVTHDVAGEHAAALVQYDAAVAGLAADCTALGARIAY